MDIYREHIIDHYKNPRNFGHLQGIKKSSHDENPSCGDHISMDILFENGIITDIRFSGEGCAISIASASMLTEMVKGKKITKIATLDFSDIQKMLGIEITPARKRCAMLPVMVLKKLILKEFKK